MIIIPDIHGSGFWKDAVKDKDDDVIFLGDYLDSYPNSAEEEVNLVSIIENLEEIIEYKKSRPSNVTLLLGNHELMYMNYEHNKIKCPHDFEHEPRITNLLFKNKELFQMAYKKVTPEKTYIFSHSGILPQWIENHKDIFGDSENIVEKTNNLFKDKNQDFIRALLDRPEKEVPGSMIWADLKEFMNYHGELGYQIFGHTKVKDFEVTEFYAALDCKKAYIL